MAYVWTGPAEDNADVYVKALGFGATPIRLTEHPAPDWDPVWSPNGRQIAFVRQLEGRSVIHLVPSLGGQERRLAVVGGPAQVGPYLLSKLSWSPDGEWLAFAERSTPHEPARIVQLSLATQERQPLTSPPEDSLGDLYPDFSPDGRNALTSSLDGTADTGGFQSVLS